MTTEARLRLLSGLKRYFHSKRAEGLLSGRVRFGARKALRVSKDLSSACREANQSAVLCLSWAIQGAVARSCRVSSAASTPSVPRACIAAGRMPRNVTQSCPASGLIPFQPRHGSAQRPGAQWDRHRVSAYARANSMPATHILSGTAAQPHARHIKACYFLLLPLQPEPIGLLVVGPGSVTWRRNSMRVLQ